MLVFRVCGTRQNLYVFSIYCNPDLGDRIFVCLLTSIAAVQAEDVRPSFLIVGDLNPYRHERVDLQPQIVRVLQPLTYQLCQVDQLVVGPNHARGGTLFLLMTDVPDLVWIAVVAPIGNSDYSTLSAVISMARLFQA